MIKNILKYIYLTSGVAYYGWVNYLSYKVEPYSTANSMTIKILFSLVSLILLTIVYILLIYPKLIYKKELKKETIIALYVGILIVPLISLVN